MNVRQNGRRPKRRSIRLPGYDYSRSGAYFVSICTKGRKCLFGNIVNREMVLNDAGRMMDKWYAKLENKFQDIRCDKHIIRNENEMTRIRGYIMTNPVHWATDRENPFVKKNHILKG